MSKASSLNWQDTVALQTLAYIYREHVSIYLEEVSRLREHADPDWWSIELMERAASVRADYSAELYAKARDKYQQVCLAKTQQPQATTTTTTPPRKAVA